MIRLFLVFTYIWQEDLSKISKVPGAPQCQSIPGNNVVGRRNHLLYRFSIIIYLHLSSFFTGQNTFEKYLAREMLIKQII